MLNFTVNKKKVLKTIIFINILMLLIFVIFDEIANILFFLIIFLIVNLTLILKHTKFLTNIKIDIENDKMEFCFTVNYFNQEVVEYKLNEIECKFENVIKARGIQSKELVFYFKGILLVSIKPNIDGLTLKECNDIFTVLNKAK